MEAQETQEASQWKNEISATLLSLRTNHYGGFGSAYYITLMSRISYSRHHGRHAFRVGMEFRDSASGSYGDVQGNQKYHEGKFNFGYQLQFSYKRLKPYTALDFIYMVGIDNEEHQGGYAGYYTKLDAVRQGIGFGPAVGIQYLLIKSLSISMESNYEFIWFNRKGTLLRGDNYSSTNKITEPIDKDHFDFYWNPINTIALNFGF